MIAPELTDFSSLEFAATGLAKNSADDVLLDIQTALHNTRTRTIDLFREVDQSGDGSITADEFRSGLKTMGLKTSDESFTAMMGVLDKDGSGDVTLKELDRALKNAERHARAEGKLGATSAVHASNRKSVVSKATLRRRTQRLQNLVNEVETKEYPQQGLMDTIDEHLLKIVSLLNKKKTRVIDFFRHLDKSGDGFIESDELYRGLIGLGLKLTNDEFRALMDRVDKDRGGEISICEMDRALKMAERRARKEGRSNELDTFLGASKRDASVKVIDWSTRSIKLSVNGSPSLKSRPRGSGSTWSIAAGGPAARAISTPIGKGSVLDSSIVQERYFDHSMKDVVIHPTLRSPRLPLHQTIYRQAVHQGRFAKAPTFPPLGLEVTKDHALFVERPYEECKYGVCSGKRSYPNSPYTQSTVDQVVFGHDMDFSGDTKFDDEFIEMFNDCRGVPSWHWGK